MFGTIKNKQGERLDYSLHLGDADRKVVIVMGHGVTGNKDRPFVVALAEGLAKAGFTALRFSFSGNGESEGAFTDSTISKEVEDLGSVIDAVTGHQIVYIGHSMGGAVGVLRTSKDPRIQYLISLAGMVHTQAFAEREFGMVTPNEGCMWDEPSCPLSQTYMDDMKKLHSLESLGAKIQVPWLLAHGTEDDVVPLQDSLDISSHNPTRAELVQIPGANHVFAGEHSAVMVDTVVAWLKKHIA